MPDDITITTPMIALATGGKAHTLSGKDAVRDYWSKALLKFPDLHFNLLKATEGIDSVALYYNSIMGKQAIEVMFFNNEGKVSRMFAYYD